MVIDTAQRSSRYLPKAKPFEAPPAVYRQSQPNIDYLPTYGQIMLGREQQTIHPWRRHLEGVLTVNGVLYIQAPQLT